MTSAALFIYYLLSIRINRYISACVRVLENENENVLSVNCIDSHTYLERFILRCRYNWVQLTAVVNINSWIWTCYSKLLAVNVVHSFFLPFLQSHFSFTLFGKYLDTRAFLLLTKKSYTSIFVILSCVIQNSLLRHTS